MEIAKSALLFNRIKKFAIIYIIFGTISMTAYYISNELIDKANADKDAIEKEISQTNSDATNIESKARDVKEASKLWRQLNESGVKRDGLEIDQAKILLNELEKYFNLVGSVDVNLTPPAELSDTYKTETTVVMASTVTLKFAGLSDELLFGFIDSLIKNFPGFINIQSLSMQRKNPLTNDIIARAAKGDFEDMVDATLIFTWKEFKDLPPK